MAIPESERTRITDGIISYLREDGLYVTSAQNRARYFRDEFPSSASPFGTSGTHSPLDVIVDDLVRGVTDYYSTSAADVKLGTVSIDSTVLTGRCGLAALVNGVAVVPNLTVTNSSLIFITCQNAPAAGFLSVSKVPGASFTITSTLPTDNTSVAWMIVEMG